MIATCRADAASVSEPYIASFIGVGRLFCYAYNAIAPTFMTSGYFTTQDWARANLDTVRKFQEAMRESALWANTHQGKSLEIRAKAAKVDPSQIGKMTRAVYTDKLDPAMIQPVIDIAMRYMNIPRFPAQELTFRG